MIYILKCKGTGRKDREKMTLDPKSLEFGLKIKPLRVAGTNKIIFVYDISIHLIDGTAFHAIQDSPERAFRTAWEHFASCKLGKKMLEGAGWIPSRKPGKGK